MPSLLTVTDWLQAYRQGATPREQLPRRLAHVQEASPAAAWISFASEAQLNAQLDALEARAAKHQDSDALFAAMPLFGVPFAIKDNIDVAGQPTTAACPAFAYTPATSAVAVQKLIEAGAVWLGKTNLDQFATGLVGVRSPYGVPVSSFAADRVSGGSSSGSAVVVARGDVPFALGTDTAGSGRVPAGFNNIVGLKPTPGRISTTGVLPACRSLDCISVFALQASDAASVLAVMEGADPSDAYSAFAPGPAQLPARLRIGVPAAPVIADASYAAGFTAAQERLQAMGHTLVPLDFGWLHETAALLYSGPWVAERHAVIEALLASQPDALDPTVRQVVAAASDFSATDAFRGQYQLRAAQQRAARLWGEVDLLLVPTAPTHPSLADLEAQPIQANSLLGTYTNFVNFLGWSALALPAGFTAGSQAGLPAGLPFGITLIAPGGFDAALARFGTEWQQGSGLPLGATGAMLQAGEPIVPPATEPVLPIAVVGAHLQGLPLNWQLSERGATLVEATTTAPLYRLFALPGTVPPKPGMMRVAEGGAAIAVEVWNLPLKHVGSFLALIPSPLGLGSLQLADGRFVHGFICESHALSGAQDITSFGGWRAFLASR
jgi:allophanate hydrolase